MVWEHIRYGAFLFIKRVMMSAKLKDILASVLAEEELELLIGSYDIVGDIAIIIVPEALIHREALIGEVILANTKNVRVVAKRAGHYGGEFRTIELKIIAGEDRKETQVTEFGVRLMLNVETTYFSVRSGNERRRIASLVQPMESVLVMFSGVGPYPLVVARHSEAEQVVGVEKNPEAYEYAIKNLKLNKKIKNVRFQLGDAADLPLLLDDRFDRVVMPLPTRADRFLPVALEMLKEKGGWVHYYEMAQEGSFCVALATVQKLTENAGKELVTSNVTRCGHCGPRTHRICVDMQIA